MPRLVAASLLLVLGLGGCNLPMSPSASLPGDAYAGSGDPLRTAVSNTSYAFSGQGPLTGNPVAAAVAVAEMEYLGVEMLQSPRLVSTTTASTLFPQARREWRGALGISPQALPQQVIDSLFAVARALRAGQPQAAEALLPASVFTLGGPATLQRLAALPPLPVTNQAAAEATQLLERHNGNGFGRF
jgi:hypothetical protein